MVLSILLLVLFQAYWLRKTYRDEFFSLRRELGLVLRESALRRQFQQMSSDSSWRISFKSDTFHMRSDKKEGTVIISDSNLKSRNGGEIRVVNMNMDSGMRRSQRQFGFDGERRNESNENIREMVIVTPVPGTVKDIDHLTTSYRKALDDNDLDIGFKLSKMNRDAIIKYNKGDTTRWNFAPRRNGPSFSMMVLEVKFDNPIWLLLPKMGWPLAFSFVMLGITITAFLFLYRSLKSQQRLAAIKNEFIGNITHELKTPIATVGVAIEALRNFNAIHDPERTREYLDISANELQRLGLLVDKVLRISMFEENKMELRKEQVDLKQLAGEVLKSMKLQLERSGVQASIDAPDAVYMAQADRMHMLSVMYNLVDNAIKYSLDNPVIQLKLTNTDAGVRFSVTDNGIGIQPEYRQKVFDKFFRVPHGNTHDVKGYGLGLSYVSEVIKKLGGSIDVQPASPKGSTFVVTLPRTS